ncbi:MAG: hypothetical protein JXB15_11355 [Anaerolineales bacterium]|nr:hypothetical protein [Anaerolineales bacterium]
MRLSRQRLLRLTAFALLVGLLAYLGVNASLAWAYVDALTHPACQTDPPPISALPPPQEHLLTTRDGLALRAWYYPAQNGAAILALGGLNGSLGERLPEISFLVQAGYGVLQIDSRACTAPPAPVTLGADEILDAAAGLDFLLHRPEVKNVGAYGFSMGGVTAIRAAARYPQITAILNDGGYFNLGDDFTEPGSPKPIQRSLFLHLVAACFWLQSGSNPWQISPVDDLPALSPRPVLLIFGEKEARSGRANLQYEAAQEPKQLWVVPGGGHGGNHQVAPQAYEQRVLDFFDQALLERK